MLILHRQKAAGYSGQSSPKGSGGEILVQPGPECQVGPPPGSSRQSGRSTDEPDVAAQTVCFTCGMPVGEPLRLNRLDNGQLCPTCRDRVLDLLPSILPDLPSRHASARAEEEDEQAWTPPEAPEDLDRPPAAS